MKLSSPILMAYPGPPRRASGLVRWLLLAVGVMGVMFYVRNSALNTALRSVHEPIMVTPSHLPTIPSQQAPKPPNPSNPGTPAVPKPAEEEEEEEEQKIEAEQPVALEPETQQPITKSKKADHPIDILIQRAAKIQQDLLKKESKNLKAAAAEYRKRRGRHPPPGFDTWFKFAEENGAVIVEDFWDQIYHDLGPFWGLPPATMRKEAWDFEMKISVRNHNTSTSSQWFWTQIWLNLTQTIEHLLPDMDIALNAMDEPRIVLPWEQINQYMEIERSTRNMPPPEEVVSDFRPLSNRPDPEVKTRSKNWVGTCPFWRLASRGCPPTSPARQAEFMHDFNHPATISLANTLPHTYQGYVSNFTLSADFCHQPDLQGLHGMMIEPLSVSTTDVLFPMFGGSKLPTNNEILLPAPMYWNNEERFSGGDDHGDSWVNKQDKVIWRGVATGGRNKPSNWKGFQRHRFVAMTNATKVKRAENWWEIAENWALPSSQYHLAAQEENRLGEWTAEWADTGFVDLMCEVSETNGTCNYTSPYYEVTPGMKMADQFDRKYLPDIDGNSFSGRYRGFLMSTSLPIKATIFREWHDSRLVPWKHFVPMDNRFMDFWGIMEYFLGYEGQHVKIEGHDKEAEKIAMDGQAWANKVLRKEDMQIYVLRLLLEYARVSDDRRDNMGWVEDLL